MLALSNVYTVHKVEDFRQKLYKRPAKTSTNNRVVHQVFRSDLTKELEIPVFINDYNYHIGGVDIANQFREAYKTYRKTQRN